MSFIEKIEQLDKELFVYLNGKHTPSWDAVMELISGKWEWIPLYLVLLVMVIVVVKKRWWLSLVSVALLVTLSDQLSVLLKNTIARYRPCHNLELKDIIHVVGKCGGTFGFVSSHAANAFALAAFLSLLLAQRWKWLPCFLFSWAALVSYSRVYLGKHYPSDITAGALLGMLIGLIVFRLYRIADARLPA